MVQQEQKIRISAILKSVREQSNGKFSFRVSLPASARPLYGPSYRFLLSREKALKIANQEGKWPLGVNLRLSGRTIAGQDAAVQVKGLTFVKILSVDGHDVQSWAERNQSPTVAPEVLKKAQKSIDKAEEEAMRGRAPPDPDPPFKTPKEAYERAMYLLRRQVRLKDPKLSKSDIWAIRDALNMLKETAGL